jgi:hypothetical protein
MTLRAVMRFPLTPVGCGIEAVSNSRQSGYDIHCMGGVSHAAVRSRTRPKVFGAPLRGQDPVFHMAQLLMPNIKIFSPDVSQSLRWFYLLISI